MIKKYLALTTAVVMAAVMFVSCGDSSDDDKKSSKKSSKSDSSAPDSKAKEDNKDSGDSKDAKEALQEQFDKLSDLKNGGKVSVKVDFDAADTDEKMTWEKAIQSQNSDTKYDFTAAVNATWKDKTFDVSFSAFDSDLFELAYDGENYYIDLTNVSDVMQAANLSTYLDQELNSGVKVSDVLTKIKLTKDDLDALSSTVSQSDSDKSNAYKEIFSDEVIDELKKLADKAEYNGSDIEIKGLTADDFKPLTEAISKKSQEVLGKDILSSANESTGDVTLDYTLTYDKDKTDQTHTVSAEDKDGDKITFTVEAEENSDALDLSAFEASKTIEDVLGVSLKDLVAAYVGSSAAQVDSNQSAE